MGPELVGAFRGAASRERLSRFFDEIGAIGRTGEGGWSRLAFTAEERAAHDVFARWAGEVGMTVTVDAIGNSFATWRDALDQNQMFAVGSHLDTVVNGGGFDGVAGVAVALEVPRLLSEHQVNPTPYAAVCFAAEEGARFGVPCIGSRVATGVLGATDLRAITDREGHTIFDSARDVSLRPAEAQRAPLFSGRLRGFMEVHIEQGLVLETRRRNLGLVDSIAGSTRLLLRLSGRADHSGATPMRLRRDALVAASELVVDIDAQARRHPTSVATVGRLDVEPGALTTVPGDVTVSVDVRDIDSDRQRDLAETILDEAIRVCRRRNIELTASLLSDQSPVILHQTLRNQLGSALRELGVPFSVLPSGAMHDAAFVAAVAPTAMLFVPSKGGISHAPEEHSEIEHVAQAAEVVAAAIATAGPPP